MRKIIQLPKVGRIQKWENCCFCVLLTTWVHAGSSMSVGVPPFSTKMSAMCLRSSSGKPKKQTRAPWKGLSRFSACGRKSKRSEIISSICSAGRSSSATFSITTTKSGGTWKCSPHPKHVIFEIYGPENPRKFDRKDFRLKRPDETAKKGSSFVKSCEMLVECKEDVMRSE